MYVESSNTKCILHRADGRTYHVYKKLNEIESELNDARFCAATKATWSI